MRSLLLSSVALLGVSFAAACTQSSDATSQSSSDIVGGIEATGAKLNAIGAVGNKSGENGFDYFCTATLIAPDLVLTAKHCATEGPPENHKYMDDQDVYFAVGPDSTKPIEMVKAKNVILSPINEGGFVGYGSDVSIYVLERQITDVKPLRFAKGALTAAEVGTILTAVGYGVRDRERNSGQRRAGAVTLRAASGQPMHAMFESKDAFYSYLRDKEGDEYISANQSALEKFWDLTLMDSYEAYVGLGKDDSQPCSGDSGGPLVKKGADGELEVVAVVSGSFKGWKYPCSLVGETYATFGPKVQDLLRDTIACKGVPIDGSCDGTFAVRCVSDAEGPQKVTRTDCGLINQVCKVDQATNKAGCVDEDAPPPANDAGSSEGGAKNDAGAGEAGPSDAGPG
jgi:secreted trypsin-like serine protease